MVSPDYCRLMARYGRWMNDRLYAVCGGLSEEARQADRGLFFRSIHGTLNHLLFADMAWLSRDYTYTSRLDGRTRTQPNWLLAAHLFNHGTHHRGQLTAALSQLGADYGSTDLPFME